jgi:hypothetical protein
MLVAISRRGSSNKMLTQCTVRYANVFSRNPYSVDNIMEVWECDLVDVQSLLKYKDDYRYLLTVIDVFSKFPHRLTLRVKTGKAVASAFLSVLGTRNILNIS